MSTADAGFPVNLAQKKGDMFFMVSLPLSALRLLKTAVQRPSRLPVMSELFCCSGKGEGYRAREIHLQAPTGPEFSKEQNLHGKIGPGWYSAALRPKQEPFKHLLPMAKMLDSKQPEV